MKHIKLFAFALCLLGVALHSSAVVIYVKESLLTGGTIQWHNTNTWIGGAIPGTSDDAIIGFCGVNRTCSFPSTVTTINFGATPISVRALRLADPDVHISGTADITVAATFNFVAGTLTAGTVRLNGATTFNVGASGFTSADYHRQNILGSTRIIIASTATLTSLGLVTSTNVRITVAPTGTFTIRPNFALDTSISEAFCYFGYTTWTSHGDPYPSGIPYLINQGTITLDSTLHPSRGNADIGFMYFYFQNYGSLTVTANNRLTFRRPRAVVDPTATPNPVTTDFYGGSWTLASDIVFSGGVVSFLSNYSASGAGALQIGDSGDCGWRNNYAGTIMNLITASTPVTVNGHVRLGGCVHTTGSKLTFANLTLSTGSFQNDIQVNTDLVILPSDSQNAAISEHLGVLTVAGQAFFNRFPTQYNDDNWKMGPSASIVFTSTSNLRMKWLEIFPLNPDNLGTASISIAGVATFESSQYVGDWDIPVQLTSTSTIRATGPATNIYQGANWNFINGGTAAGRFAFTQFYGVNFALRWVFESTVTFQGPANGISWVPYFALSDKNSASTTLPQRTLRLPSNVNIGSILADGNGIGVEGPTNSIVTIQNFRGANDIRFCCAGTTFRMTNYSLLDADSSFYVLDGASLTNEGKMDLSIGIQINTNINTKGRFINKGTLNLIEGTVSEDLQIINYGDLNVIINPSPSGIFSNGTIDLNNNGASLNLDALVLLPTSHLKARIFGPSSSDITYIFYKAGLWCHVQGEITITFISDVPGSTWSPNNGMSWDLFRYNPEKPCIGRFTQVNAVGLSAGQSIKVEDVLDPGTSHTMRVTICATGTTGCGTSTATTVTPTFPTRYLSLLPAGSYMPPAGTIPQPTAVPAPEPTIVVRGDDGPAPSTSTVSTASAVTFSGLFVLVVVAVAQLFCC